MQNEPKQSWEQQLHEELRQLPELKAPPVIAKNVMATIRAREQQPWWQCPWVMWPRMAQAGSAVLVLALLSALGYFAGHAGDQVGAVSQRASEWLTLLQGGYDKLNTLVSALVSITRLPGQQVLIFAATLAGVMYLACIGIGTVLYRTVFQKR